MHTIARALSFRSSCLPSAMRARGLSAISMARGDGKRQQRKTRARAEEVTVVYVEHERFEDGRADQHRQQRQARAAGTPRREKCSPAAVPVMTMPTASGSTIRIDEDAELAQLTLARLARRVSVIGADRSSGTPASCHHRQRHAQQVHLKIVARGIEPGLVRADKTRPAASGRRRSPASRTTCPRSAAGRSAASCGPRPRSKNVQSIHQPRQLTATTAVSAAKRRAEQRAGNAESRATPR